MRISKRESLLIIAAVAAAGAAVFFHAREPATAGSSVASLSLPPREGANPARLANPPEPRAPMEPTLLPEEHYDFDTFPTEATLVEVGADLEARIFSAAMALSGDEALDGDRASRLASLASEHMEILLSGSWERWRDFATRHGVGPPDVAPPSEQKAGQWNSWDNASQGLRTVPLAVKHIEVRAHALRGASAEPILTPGFIGTAVRGAYPKFDGENMSQVDIFEIVIPLKYDTPQRTGPDLPVHLFLRYAFDRSTNRWSPYNAGVHANSLGDGRIRNFVF